jgi:hypothetical protein
MPDGDTFFGELAQIVNISNLLAGFINFNKGTFFDQLLVRSL